MKLFEHGDSLVGRISLPEPFTAEQIEAIKKIFDEYNRKQNSVSYAARPVETDLQTEMARIVEDLER